jgi:hypothetical protein
MGYARLTAARVSAHAPAQQDSTAIGRKPGHDTFYVDADRSICRSGRSMLNEAISSDGDFVSIGGVRLPMRALVDPRIHNPEFAAGLRQQFERAAPFPHLVIEALFHPLLLEQVAAEFERIPNDGWRTYRNHYEQTFRSQPQAALGPASRLYFGLVNSGEFIRFLCRVTGIDVLIADPWMFGGGLHESRNGGRFSIHRDFDRHPHTGLRNRLVLLTYLNKDWNSDWGGDLELWDAEQRACVTRVAPRFGVSLLMAHGRTSYHGHPAPLQMPAGVTRRSLANYFYSAPEYGPMAGESTTTQFMQPLLRYSIAWGTIRVLRRWTPPAIWDAARQLRQYWAR